MFKKLLYLYNDGHNPFPHIKGGALEETDTGGYRYDMNDEDDNIYLPNSEDREGGRPTGDWYERDGDTFTIHPRHGEDYKLYYDKDTATFSYDVPEGDEPDVIDVSQEPLEYIDYGDEDEGFTNEALVKVLDNEKKTKNYTSITPEEKVNVLTELIDSLTDKINKIGEQAQKVTDNHLLVNKENNKKLKRTEIMLNIERQKDPVSHKQEVMKAIKLYLQIGDKTPLTKLNDKQVISNHIKFIKNIPIDDIYKIIYILVDRMDSIQMSKSEKEKQSYVINRLYDVANPKMNVAENQIKQYMNMMEVIDHQKDVLEAERDQLNIQIKKGKKGQKQTIKKTQEQQKEELRQQTKVLHETKQEKDIRERNERIQQQKATAEDMKEIEAEQRAKAEAGMSKAALKKQKSKENKAAKDAAEVKAAEAPVVNAKSAVNIINTHGKKLEEFFTTSKGKPILEKLSGDKSKIYDNEYNPEIPEITVTYNDNTEGPLSKACTLDLYNDTYVFEIKNYMENSITDSIIPLQGTKLKGTGYFNPLYLENGELYNLELNYIDPNTGEKITKFILPENPNGRILVIVVRLKEGLYEYKPMLDKEHVELVPIFEDVKKTRPVLTPQGKQLYAFSNTTLQKCKDYNKKSGSYNIQPYLKKI